MQLELSERQRSTIGFAVTILAASVIVVAVGLVIFGIGAFAAAFSSVLLPLAVAGVAALLARPYFSWLRRRTGLPDAAALALVFVSGLVPMVAFSWFFGALAVSQVSELVERAPILWRERILPFLYERWPQVLRFLEDHPLGVKLKAMLEGSEAVALQALEYFGTQALHAGVGVAKGVGALLSWLVLPIYFAFFLMAEPPNWGRADRFLPFFKEETRRDVVYLVKEFVNIVLAFFRGQIVVAIAQGILLAIGFAAIGLKYGLLLSILLGILNVIPYLGSIVGLSVALPLAMFQPGGGPTLVVWTLAVFLVVQAIEGYVLTPKIMGDRTGLHPLAIIVSVFFWATALDGIMGMVLAIPLTAFLVVFWRLLREKYIGEIV